MADAATEPVRGFLDVEPRDVERLGAGSDQVHPAIRARGPDADHRGARTGAALTRPVEAAYRPLVRSYPNDHREETATGGHAVIEGVEVSTDHLIGGSRVASSERFVDVSPIDEQAIAEVARGGAAEVDAAVHAAAAAFDGWARTPPKERAAILHAVADGVEARERRSPRSRRATTGRSCDPTGAP